MSITTLLWEGRFWVLSETSCYTHVKRYIPVSNTIVITTNLTNKTTNLGRSSVTFFPSLYMSITTLLWEGRFWVLCETSCYTHVKRHIPVGNTTMITTNLTNKTTNLGRSTVTFFSSLYMSITTLLWEGRFWVLSETSSYTHVKRYIPVDNTTVITSNLSYMTTNLW